MGHRLLLGSFALVPAIQDNLIGACTTEDEALDDALRLMPDVLFVTEGLEVGYGISLVEKMKVYLPELKTLLFLDSEKQEVVDKAVSSGADGVMFTSNIGDGDGDFIRAMNAISEGRTYFPSDVTKSISQNKEERLAILGELTEREVEVLKEVSVGMTNSEICSKLNISIDTTKTHIKNLLSKLSGRNRTDLCVLALRNDITL
jgi:DNA-binding NarL/FixJ family response regulator